MKNKILLLLFVSIFCTSCASFWLPKTQNITVKTEEEEAVVYFDNLEYGEGSTIKEKTKKDGPKQVIIQTPGYKDNYKVLLPIRRPIAYYFLQPFNILTVGIGIIVDKDNDNTILYNKTNNFNVENKIVKRDSLQKYILISNIELDLKNHESDFNIFDVKYIKNEEKLLSKLEKTIEDFEIKNEKQADENNKDTKKYYKTLSKSINYDDTKFSTNILVTLIKTGYVDTINRVFTDNNNTLVLEGKITKIYGFNILSKALNSMHKMKIHLNWYIKNIYGEKLDSLETTEYSGEFTNDAEIELAIADAIDISYIKLHQTPILIKHIKKTEIPKNSDPILSINKPNTRVNNKKDAEKASVVIKTENGHGSGFAITNDGFIITNYHIIADKSPDIYGKIEVIASNGKKMDATIIRVNKFNDLVLLKVNYNFEKAFEIKNIKSFEKLEDIYAIGAPVSIELANSISTGIISSERIINNNDLLQLGMSINSGNSGGPVFNKSGTLHGIIVSKISTYNAEGICFAIPSYLIPAYLNIKYK